MTLKASKYHLKPNAEQCQKLSKAFGHNRFVWNWAMALRERYYRRFQKTVSKRRLQDQLVKKKKQPKFAWLNEVNAQSYLATLDNLDKAYKAFFKGNAKHPRFKSKKSNWHSYHNPQHTEIDAENNRIKIPKIGWVKCKVHRMVKGKIKTCTVKLHPSGKFTVSVLFDTQETLPDKTFLDADKVIGLDLGIKTFATCSDGEPLENPAFLEKTLKRLNQQQRILSRKQKGSNSRSKQRLKVAKLHEKVSNQRNNYLHQITHKLVCESQAVGFVVEDLHVKGLIQNKKLSRRIADVAWGSFLQKLAYKCDWYGKSLLKVNRFYPSSKTCSRCGWIKPDLKLSDRIFECRQCGHKQDRDLNAAINIKQQGLKELEGGRNYPCRKVYSQV